MPLIPRTLPVVSDPQVDQALSARWLRTRALLLVSMVALPVALVVVCLVFTALSDQRSTWWVAIAAVTAAANAIALVVWLRRHGLQDPHSWLPATVLMTGTEVVVGVVPGFSATAGSASGAVRVAASGLLAVGITFPALACRIAHRACQTLLHPLIADFGSTRFPVVVDDQPTQDSRVRVEVGVDRVEWTTWTGRSRRDTSITFPHLRQVTTAGDAVVLHTVSGRWNVPAADPALLSGILRRRKELWDNHVDAAIERERQLYRDLLVQLGPRPVVDR